MDTNGVQPGQLVKSRAGRDKDRYFIIYDIPGNNIVRVVDGQLRKVENPKQKKLKHLRCYDQADSEITEKLAKGRKISNAEVRKALQSLGINPGNPLG